MEDNNETLNKILENPESANTEEFKKETNNLIAKAYERSIKNSNAIIKTSAIVASLSSLVAVGNYILGNPYIGLQNTGSAIALFGYAVGYSKKIKYIKEQQENFLNPKKNETPIEDLKNYLQKLKSNLQEYKVSKNMDIVAGTGFLISTISSILLCIDGQMFALAGAALSAIISVLEYHRAFDNNLLINNTEESIEKTNDLISKYDEIIPEEKKLTK